MDMNLSTLWEALCPRGSGGKESACNAGDPGLIPGSGRSPEEGNGNPLQYSFLENPMDRGSWQSMGCKESDMTEWSCKELYSSLGVTFISLGGQRSLQYYSPWDFKESEKTWLNNNKTTTNKADTIPHKTQESLIVKLQLFENQGIFLSCLEEFQHL